MSRWRDRTLTALEALHAHGMGATIEELEHIAGTATSNLRNSAVRLIAKSGTLSAVESLVRLYDRFSPGAQKDLLEALEPLAGRLGLRITSADGSLLSSLVVIKLGALRAPVDP